MNRTSELHSWAVSPRKAVQLQHELASRIIATGRIIRPRFYAGADAAFIKDRQLCIAGVVLLDAADGAVIEQHVVTAPLTFPYVPGLLSFREAPAVIAAIQKLEHEPDVLMIDGQGLAHPRRFGIASHVGLWLDVPTIGCAKSRLTGTHREPGPRRGASVRLLDEHEVIGRVVRSQTGIRPLYISVGHRVSLPQAVELTLRACTRYRMPEPTRLADRLVAMAKWEILEGRDGQR